MMKCTYNLSCEGINPFSFPVVSSQSDDTFGVNIEITDITEIAQKKKIKKR